MVKPTPIDIINLVRETYGLSLADAIEAIKTPLHPKGMRDEFAMQSIAGINPGRLYGDDGIDAIADSAYKLADAMLKARAK